MADAKVSPTAGGEAVSLIGKRNFNPLPEVEEWILILKNSIGQDQPDHQEIAAFGRRPPAAGEKS